MNKGQLVKIIASNPAPGQDGILEIVGNTYPISEVERNNGRETGRVSIIAKEFGGTIVLQKSEYVIVAE